MMEQKLVERVEEKVESVDDIIDLELLRSGEVDLFENDAGHLFMKEPEPEGNVGLREMKKPAIVKIEFDNGIPQVETIEEEEFKNQDLNSVTDIDSQMAD
jgi:hypothetical protein